MRRYFDQTLIITDSNHTAFFNLFNPENYEIISPEKNKSRLNKSISDQIRNLYFNYLRSKCQVNKNRLINFGEVPENPLNQYTGDINMGKIDGNKLNKVLLFRYDAIGDYIITTPLIRWLKHNKPSLQIDVITSYRNDPMIRKDPLITNTFPVHPSKNYFFSWRQAIKKASSNEYDIIFGLVFTYMTKCALFAVNISPHAEKVTIMHDERKNIYGKVFNMQIHHQLWKEHWAVTMHRAGSEAIEFNKDNYSFTDQSIRNGKEFTNPYIFIFNKDIEAAVTEIKKFNLQYRINPENIIIPDKNTEVDIKGSPYCILNISAYSPNRQWSVESCTIICNKILLKYPELNLFITGGANDLRNIMKVVDNMGSNRCHSLILKLSEFIAFTAGASFIISPDTATVHIAAAARVPVVGLFAELIKAAEWYPFNTKFAIVVSPDPFTINSIDTDKVLEAVEMVYGDNLLSRID